MNEPNDLPQSIAIAGAWGYIGRKFLDVALARNLTTYVFDPGPAPDDIDLGRITRVHSEAEFSAIPAELFHLAVHPEHRRLDLLLARNEPLWILNEKPMAVPGHPEHCQHIIDAVSQSPAIVLYDFPELFDPLTARVLEFLSSFETLEIRQMIVQRSKDREDPANPRNYKRMVAIQYQESVHCLAFVLHLMANVNGSLAAAMSDGVCIQGVSEPYVPPNPEAYLTEVDGRCLYTVEFGPVRISGHTDFKRGAPWAKLRVIRGLGDGQPFEIGVSYLEGQKFLHINGAEQPCDPNANSYEQVLRTFTRWSRQHSRSQLMEGLFPNPSFARMAYQLSGALWQSCQSGTALEFRSAGEIIAREE